MFRDVVFQDVVFQNVCLEPLARISFRCEVPTPSVFEGQQAIGLLFSNLTSSSTTSPNTHTTAMAAPVVLEAQERRAPHILTKVLAVWG